MGSQACVWKGRERGSSMTNPVDYGFPKPKNAVKGLWKPIFIETILGSGERVTIGVMAISSDGKEWRILPAQGLDRLYCLFGDDADIIVYAAQKSLRYMRDDFSVRGVEAFEVPRRAFLSVQFGPATPGAGHSLDEIAETGLRACSSLNNPMEIEPFGDVDIPKGSKEPKLNTMLKEYVAIKNRKYLGYFDVPFSSPAHSPDVKRRIGFSGEAVVSNFYAINANQPRRSSRPIQSAILNLMVHRDSRSNDLFSSINECRDYAMIVMCPEDNGLWSESKINSMEEMCEELEADCKIEGIRFVPRTKVSLIGDYLIDAENRVRVGLS